MKPESFLPTTEIEKPIVRGPGAGPAVGVLGRRSIFKVTSSETGGAYAVIEQEVAAGNGPPLHVHRRETEIFYVLEGDFEITVGGEKFPAQAGASAVCPRDIPHTFRNVGSSDGRMLVTIIPGHFGDYFIEVDHGTDPGIETIRRLCAKYGVEILE